MTFGSLVDWWTRRPHQAGGNLNWREVVTTELKPPHGTRTATQNPPSAPGPMAPRFPQKVRTKINSHHSRPAGAWTMVGSRVIIGVNASHNIECLSSWQRHVSELCKKESRVHVVLCLSLYHLLWLPTLALRTHISKNILRFGAAVRKCCLLLAVMPDCEDALQPTLS